MSAPAAGRYVGQSVTRVEDDRILSGRGRYVDDIRLPGMLHAVFVRSSIPHGRLTAVDVEAAREMDGVVAVITAADLEGVVHPLSTRPDVPDVAKPVFTALASDRVRYVGDPIALVVAQTRHQAEDARDAVFADYEALEPVASIEHALDPKRPPLFDDTDSNLLYTEERTFGDPDSAFASAAHVVRAKLSPQRVAHVPMECRGGVADHNAGTGELVYYATTQSPHALKLTLGGVLGQPAERLRVITPDIGGAFGQKALVNREDFVVCAASRLLGAPVKWVEDRVENMTSASHARSEIVEVAAAVDSDGTIRALDVDLKMDLGAYPGLPFPPSFLGPIVRTMVPGPYRIEHLRWTNTTYQTNKASYGTYRGPWAVESLLREVLIDRIAGELGLEPFEVRRRNILHLDEQPRKMVTGPTVEGALALEALERAGELAGLEEFRREQAEARAQGRLIGLGFATYIEPAPGPPDLWDAVGASLPDERAVARLEPDGHLTVITAQAPHGQSHETTLAQIAASEFGIPIEHVRVVHGDTQQTPFSIIGTGGSRAATLASGAALHATRAVKEKVLEFAGDLLEIGPGDLEIRDAVVMPKGDPEHGMPLAQLAMALYFMGREGEDDGLRSTVTFPQPPGGWSGGTHACFVEVDPQLGTVEIKRYIVVEDCGDLINPAVVEGQIRGGIAQGVGIALLENALYDEDANFLAGTFMDYLVPTSMEIPSIEIEHLAGKALHEVNYRGVGEGGTIAAPPAIVNAVSDALGGVAIDVLPMTPELVLGLIDEAGA